MSEFMIDRNVSSKQLDFVVYNLVFAQQRDSFTAQDIFDDANMRGLVIEETQLRKTLERLVMSQVIFNTIGGYRARYV